VSDLRCDRRSFGRDTKRHFNLYRHKNVCNINFKTDITSVLFGSENAVLRIQGKNIECSRDQSDYDNTWT